MNFFHLTAFARSPVFTKTNPYMLQVNGTQHRVDYEPAESSNGLFGGNSNWRGPIWFPLNYLLIESLQKFHHYLGADFKVECPTGSGQMMNAVGSCGRTVSKRLSRIFLIDGNGRRPVFGPTEKFQTDPNWRDLVPFHEYFHGDNGIGNRREPSNRLDRAGCEAPATKRA